MCNIEKPPKQTHWSKPQWALIHPLSHTPTQVAFAETGWRILTSCRRPQSCCGRGMEPQRADGGRRRRRRRERARDRKPRRRRWGRKPRRKREEEKGGGCPAWTTTVSRANRWVSFAVFYNTTREECTKRGRLRREWNVTVCSGDHCRRLAVKPSLPEEEDGRRHHGYTLPPNTRTSGWWGKLMPPHSRVIHVISPSFTSFHVNVLVERVHRWCPLTRQQASVFRKKLISVRANIGRHSTLDTSRWFRLLERRLCVCVFFLTKC